MKRKIEIEKIYSLTPMQEGMLFHSLKDADSSAYFQQHLLTLKGEIDGSLLEQSFNKVIERHAVFRTVFNYETAERPLQILLKRRNLKVYFEDISHLHNSETGPYIDEFKNNDRERGFNLAKDILLRVSLFKTGNNVYKLIWSFHHILMDGWCVGIVINELLQIYRSLRHGRPVELEPVTPYWRYIKWITRQDREEGLRYWKKELEGYERPVSFLKSGPSPGHGEYKLEKYRFSIEGELKEALERIAKENRVTMNMVFQSIWGVLLQRYNNCNDVVFGVVTSVRPPEIEGIEGMIGLFINTVPVRIRCREEQGFSQVLKDVRENARLQKAFEYLPLARIQSNSSLKRDLINHIMVFENYPVREEIKNAVMEQNTGFTVEDLELHEQTNYDFNIFITQGKSYIIKFLYNALVHENDLVESAALHFDNMVRQIAAEPGIPIKEIDIITGEEKRRILMDFNETRSDYPGDKTIHRLFAEQAARTPDGAAVIGAEQLQITYGELDKKFDRWAHYLRSRGVGPDSIVAVMLERSMEMVIGILGILKAGGAYLPILPDYPEERIKYMLEDSGAEILLAAPAAQVKVEVEVKEDSSKRIEIIDISKGFSSSTSTLTSTCQVGSANLAYVIYTSGSTGKPKGVMIEHRSIINTLLALQEKYPLREADVYLLKTSYVFDVSVAELFGWFLAGGKLAILEKDGDRDPGKIVETVERTGVTHINFVPSMFDVFVDFLTDNKPGILSGLQYLFLAGEAIYPEYVSKFRLLGLKCRLENIYGPTEASIYGSWYSLSAWDGTGSVPIGKPLYNVQLYILDKHEHIQPVGVPGELCISGSGLSRGYLNNPGLTAEKFVNSPYSPTHPLTHSTIYRTGDLARWLHDGNIEFLGRIDRQVKIRGFRLELAEIESRLLEHNEIKKALVVAKEDKNENKYLCAYIAASSEISAAELRTDMAKYLPHYMIPAYFVEIDDIPLTPNGKIDWKALPPPGEKTVETYIAPGNEVEEKLAEVWQSVLGRERIGINENFFTIGGDSIKSIQIAARMNKAGFKVEMRDIFRNPSISQLAPLVKITSRVVDQSVIRGIVPLTPIQRDFFRYQRIDPHHYNQAVMLYSPQGFDEAAVKAVFKKIQEHHDALRMTYKEEGGEIVQTNRGPDHPFSLEIYDFRDGKNALEALEEKADTIQASISLEKGPLMKIGLFRLDDGDRLLIVIHHLVIDTVSWRILFEDIETLYRQHKKGKPLALPLKTDSFMTWSKKLSRYAHSEEFLEEKAYWKKLESLDVPPVKKDFAGRDNHLEDTASLSFRLGKEETGRLLTTVNVPFGTDINDILLTALGLAIKETFGNNRVLIALEGHGREEIIKDIDITRTVGWFTSVYPVLLDMSYAGDLSRQIKEIKESLLQVPHKGIGYGILEYLTGEEYKRELGFKLNPQISFNYLGQFDTDVEQMSSFKIARESTGKHLGDKGQRRYSFDVSGMISDKQLSLSIAYNKKQYKPGTVKTLMDHYMTELKRIISYCSAREKRELTPGDLTYRKLSIDTLDRIAGSIQGKIEDIYPLAPIQEGMLFHSLYDSFSSAYYQQMSYRLQGDLDITLVKKSLNELFKRYDILRTVFIHENVDRPLQVVLEEREVGFYYEDLSKTMTDCDRDKFIEEFKEKDKRRSFDLSEDVLMRAAFFRLDISRYELIWSYHHILMDGWCFRIFISDFIEIYNSYLENRPYNLPGTQPFRRYIEWLEKQDKKESASFWEKYLAGYNRAVGIPRVKSREKSGNKYDTQHVIRELEKEKTAALVEWAAKHSAALTEVFQAVWGVLLAKYNGQRNADVVYGLVVSGRPPGLAGVESMMGLFINTIPVRIKYEEKATFKDLLHYVREQAADSLPYHYSPLADIQSLSPLKQALIDHVLIFENLPLPERIDGLTVKNKGDNREGNLEISKVETVEQGNYDLEVVILPGERLTVILNYNAGVYEKELMEGVLEHVNIVIEQILNHAEIPIEEIDLLSGEERKTLLRSIKDKHNDSVMEAYAAGAPGNMDEAEHAEFDF